MTDSSKCGVGFIGLGDQGGPMARAIAEAGWPLSVWARRPETLAAVAAVPHQVCATVADLGRECAIVALCLRSDADVEDVLINQGLLASMKPESVVVNHGTGSPDICPSLEERGRQVGVFVLDAPVSGGREAAEAKTLTTMAGGDRQAFERCLPIFKSFSRHVAYLGPSGAGQFAKLVNNDLFAANLKNAADMLEVAEQLGFDLKNLVDLILASSGRSFALEAIVRTITPELLDHHQAMIEKDVHLFSEAARQRGVSRSPLEDQAERGVAAVPSAVRRYRRSL